MQSPAKIEEKQLLSTYNAVGLDINTLHTHTPQVQYFSNFQ